MEIDEFWDESMGLFDSSMNLVVPDSIDVEIDSSGDVIDNNRADFGNDTEATVVPSVHRTVVPTVEATVDPTDSSSSGQTYPVVEDSGDETEGTVYLMVNFRRFKSMLPNPPLKVIHDFDLNEPSLEEGQMTAKYKEEKDFDLNKLPIKGLKDMINVKLEAIRDEESGGEARYQCPIAGPEFNGKYRFSALRKCAHVLSAKALKEMKSSACIVCYKEFDESDKFPINRSEEEVVALRERMEEERARVAKDAKKTKKMKNEEVGVAVANGGENGFDTGRLSGKKHRIGADAKALDMTVSGKISGKGKIENVKGVSNGVGAVKRFKARGYGAS